MTNSPRKLVAFVLFFTSIALAAHAQTFTTLVSFDGTNGAQPQASLIQGLDGNLYGTTTFGGAGPCNNAGNVGCGVIIEVTLTGALTTLYSFCVNPACFDGALPNSPLTLGVDGSFYGLPMKADREFAITVVIYRAVRFSESPQVC